MTLSLDTTAAIDILRGRRPEVRERFEGRRRRGDEIVMSSVVLFELAYGVRRSSRPEARMQELDSFLAMVPVVSFDGGDAMTAGALRLQLETPGLSIGAADLLIAAQALNRSWSIVTSNLRQFGRANLPIIDWRISDAPLDTTQMNAPTED